MWGAEPGGAAAVGCDEMLEMLHQPLLLLTPHGSGTAQGPGSIWKALHSPCLVFFSISRPCFLTQAAAPTGTARAAAIPSTSLVSAALLHHLHLYTV